MERILIVEDDESMRMGIAYALKKEGYLVQQAENLAGVRACLEKGVDLMILDVNLPDGDGRSFLKELRADNPVPVLFLTARVQEEEQVLGFDAGGDDYMTKPFSMAVLLRRIRALLRRTGMQDRRFYYNRDLVCDQEQRLWKKRGEVLKLTATEQKILELFAANKNRVLTREVMLERIWDAEGNFVEEKTLNVNIRRLREKLEDDPKNPVYIKTVFGIGYKWSDENEG